MEPVLTRNEEPAPAAQPACLAAGRAGSALLLPAVWGGVGQSCARAAGEAPVCPASPAAQRLYFAFPRNPWQQVQSAGRQPALRPLRGTVGGGCN